MLKQQAISFDRCPEHVAADARVLCDKARVLGATIKGTFCSTKKNSISLFSDGTVLTSKETDNIFLMLKLCDCVSFYLDT